MLLCTLILKGHHSRDVERNVCKIVYSNSSKLLLKFLKYERAERKNYFFTHEGIILALPWNYSASKSVAVQNLWTNNPSILELSEGSFFFSAVLVWTYDLDCGVIEDLSLDLISACLKANAWKITDGSTTLGYFNMKSCEARLLPINSYGGWNYGDAWGDTKLLYYVKNGAIMQSPADEENLASSSEQTQRRNKSTTRQSMILTSQKIEYIYSTEWEGLDEGAFLQVSMLHLAYLNVYKKKIRFSRMIFFNPVEDKRRESDRLQGHKLSLFDQSIDFGRELCSQRPDGQPQFPFLPYSFVRHPNASMWFRKDVYKENSYNNRKHLFSYSNNIEVQQLKPWSKMRSYTFKDKNWSPFIYRKKLLWSFVVDPYHIVCENDIDIRDHVADCVLCVEKYRSKSESPIASARKKLNTDWGNYFDPVFHLNGVPTFKLHGESYYLGVMHAIAKSASVYDLRGEEEWRKAYIHFFYRMADNPPFSILDISAPIPLPSGRSIAPWFNADEKVMVAYVSGFQYNPRKIGQEITLSFGFADASSMVKQMSIQDALKLF